MIEAVQALEKELNMIKNPTIREFTTFILTEAPAYLTEVPSSSSGKYHPPQSRVEPGGLISHLRATVVFANRLCRAYSIEKDDLDAVISACLLHDILKYSDFEKGPHVKLKHTTKYHDYDSALFVHLAATRYLTQSGTEVPWLKDITGCIAWHMGQWTKRKNPAHKVKKFPEEYSLLETIVHLADMCSSEPDVHLISLESSFVG